MPERLVYPHRPFFYNDKISKLFFIHFLCKITLMDLRSAIEGSVLKCFYFLLYWKWYRKKLACVVVQKLFCALHYFGTLFRILNGGLKFSLSLALISR